MKKLKSILLSACILGTVCSLTSCNGEQWEFYEDEGVCVSNSDCKDMVSDNKKENIRKKLENKYKDIKPTITEKSIKGLLKDEISLEKDDDFYCAESIRAEELDSIFEIDGHIVETYVDVYVYTDEDFMAYEIYAEYDNDGNTYCFAEVDFMSPVELEKKAKEKNEEQKRLKEKMGEYKYKNIEIEYHGEDVKFLKEEDIIKPLEEKFKDAKLKVTENDVQLMEYKFSVELNGNETNLSEEILMEELDNIFEKHGDVETSAHCSVTNDGTVIVNISADYKWISGYTTASLTFVK